MNDVWYNCKLWEIIFRSVRRLSLVKARVYAGWFHWSSVYLLKLNFWVCSWVCCYCRSSVVCSVFWWLGVIGFQWFSDSKIVDVSIGCFVISYEGWMNCGVQIVILCFRNIQSENVWKVVPEGKKIVGLHLRTSILTTTRGKGVEAPFQGSLENKRRLKPSAGCSLCTGIRLQQYKIL